MAHVTATPGCRGTQGSPVVGNPVVDQYLQVDLDPKDKPRLGNLLKREIVGYSSVMSYKPVAYETEAMLPLTVPVLVDVTAVGKVVHI